MTGIWTRFSAVMLVLVFVALLAVIAMLATGVRGGPLDPPGPPSSTDSVKLPGTPISGPTTISSPGHYYLTKDVRVTGAVIAITINASEVSLDLGGFTIDGNDIAGSYGIYVAGAQSDITIENGTVKDFHFGVDFGDDLRVHVRQLSAVSNVRGFQVGYRSVMSDCSAIDNTETGIYIPAADTTIRDCVVHGNTGDGISIAASFNLVERSR